MARCAQRSQSHPKSNLDENMRREGVQRYIEWSKRSLLTALAIEVLKSESGDDRGEQFQNAIYNIGASVSANHQGKDEETLLRDYIDRLRDVEESKPLVALAGERLHELTKSDHPHKTTPQKATSDDVEDMLTCDYVKGMLMSEIFNLDRTSFAGQKMSNRLHQKLKRVLQCYFGYDQICLLFYLTLKESLNCDSPEACFKSIANTEGKRFVDIHTQTIGELAKALFDRKDDFISVLCRDFLLHSNLKFQHQTLARQDRYDGGDYWNTSTEDDIRGVFYDLSAEQVHRYFAEGLRVYLERDAKSNNQCDISAGSWDYGKDFQDTVKGKEVTYKDGREPKIFKTGKQFTEEERKEIATIKKVYQSKQPSKINIWNDPVTLCPPNYEPSV